MLQLLQPIWLFAMAGPLVPVAIHLWNNKQGKVLAIGSIALLEKTSRKKSRSRRLSEWVLLLLRCLLLILLSLLLAGPFWKRTSSEKGKGWVLVGEGVKEHRSLIDSFIKVGYKRYDLRGSSWWAGFAALDQQAPAGVPFYVYTDGALEHFSGERPSTARPVYWQVDTPRDSTVSWVEDVWQRGHDSVEMILGSSKPTGVSYSSRETGRQETKAPVDTTTLRVVVYTDEKYTSDGRWVAAAVKALQQYTRKEIRVSMGASGTANWVFWLSLQPLPADVKAANIFLYEPGREIPVDTWFKGSDVPVEKVTGQKMPAEGLRPLWVDGFGRPLLAVEETAGGRRFHFFSHFDPAWNGLVWSGDFPVRMEELLLDRPRKSQDNRVIDPEQVAPTRGTPSWEVPSRGKASGEAGASERKTGQAGLDLAPAGWLLIFLTLLAERILSFKRAKNGGG